MPYAGSIGKGKIIIIHAAGRAPTRPDAPLRPVSTRLGAPLRNCGSSCSHRVQRGIQCHGGRPPCREKMERTARLRHDLRNQVQIVNALAARGEFELAQHHIAAMLKELEK